MTYRIQASYAGKHGVSVAVHRDNETREYRARLHLNGKPQTDADYFTDDKRDAETTAQRMREDAERAIAGAVSRALAKGSVNDARDALAGAMLKQQAARVDAGLDPMVSTADEAKPAPTVDAGTIDAAPAWCGLFALYGAVIKDGNAKGRAALVPELARLCAMADALIALSGSLTPEQETIKARALTAGLTRCGY